MTKRLRVLLALLAAFALAAAACGDDSDSGGESSGGGDTPDGPTITIGAQDFGESAIMAEIYGQGLEASGYDVSQQELGGFRDIEIGAFESGDINFAPEYAASMLEFLNDNAGEASGDIAETAELLQGQLEGIDLTALEATDAVDTNTFVVLPETAEEVGLETLGDLGKEAFGLGAPQDCETNPFCIPGLQEVYDVDLSENFTPLDAGVVADALEAGEIDVAVLFSTSGIIADKGWVVLEDDMNMLAADNIIPVVTAELVEAYGDDFVARVDEISATLNTENVTELNRQFDIDKEDAA
ncbi:MAG: ABC transporter substrate-binding protein, partial [Actinomycetota bacterium]